MLQAHQLAFDPLKDFIKEHRGGVTLAVDHLVVVFRHVEALLHQSDSLLECMIQALKLTLLFFALLTDTDKLVE